MGGVASQVITTCNDTLDQHENLLFFSEQAFVTGGRDGSNDVDQEQCQHQCRSPRVAALVSSSLSHSKKHYSNNNDNQRMNNQCHSSNNQQLQHQHKVTKKGNVNIFQAVRF